MTFFKSIILMSINFDGIYLFGIFIILFTSCKKEKSYQDFEFQDVALLKIVEEFQRQNVPNNDKIILMELYRNIVSNPVLFLSTIEHPNELDIYEDFFIYHDDNYNLVLFYHSPAFSYLNFRINRSEITNIKKIKYGNIDINAEYEVDMSWEALCGGWYITREDSVNYKVFNMTDSIRLYGNVNCQYKKLEKFIDPFCECCECVDK
jgi:hypothetical protein